MALPTVSEANFNDITLQQFRPGLLEFVLGEVENGVVTTPQDLTGCTAQLLIANKFGPTATVYLALTGDIATPTDGTIRVPITAAQVSSLTYAAPVDGVASVSAGVYDLVLTNGGDSRSFFKGTVKIELGVNAP